MDQPIIKHETWTYPESPDQVSELWGYVEIGENRIQIRSKENQLLYDSTLDFFAYQAYQTIFFTPRNFGNPPPPPPGFKVVNTYHSNGQTTHEILPETQEKET